MPGRTDSSVIEEWAEGRPLGRPDEEAFRQHAWGMYRCAVAHADAQVGRLFAWLQSSGEWPRTIVVVVADHGEEFGEHGFTGHKGQLSESVLRVPLVILVPGTKPRQIDAVVRNFDLHPTLLDYARAPPARNLDAVSLRPFVEGGRVPELAAMAAFPRIRQARTPAAWRHHAREALRMGRYLLLRDETGRHELYDVVADRRATRDVALQRVGDLRLVTAVADRLRPSEQASQAPAGESKLDPALVEHLRALGYVE